MNKFSLMLRTLPRNLGDILFGVWLIAMALTDREAFVRLNFTGAHVVLGILLVAAGICMMARRS